MRTVCTYTATDLNDTIVFHMQLLVGTPGNEPEECAREELLLLLSLWSVLV